MPARQRARPWETPWEHLEREEHAELKMLSWIARSQVAIGRLLEDVLRTQEKNMSDLSDQITAAATLTDQAAVDAANRVIATINDNNAVVAGLQEHNAADDKMIADLQAQIAAGVVTPETAQAVVNQLVGVKAKIDAIDAVPLPPIE